MQKTRYIPAGFTEYKPEIGDYPKGLFAVYVDLAKFSAIFYTKKQSTHTFYNRFRNMDGMKAKINSTISSLMAWEDKKVERAAERKAPTTMKVGDILYSSWGYDQTNIDFYLVTKVMGTRTVELREIGSKIVASSGSENRVAPVEDNLLDKKPLIKRVSNGHVHLNSYASATLYDGSPKYETAAGWGH